MTPLTPEEWERVECLAKNFAARPDELPITYIRTIGTTADLSLLLRALAERTAERDALKEQLEGEHRLVARENDMADMLQSVIDRGIVVEAERDKLQQWVHDLQAGMYINCVYCGHRYGPDDEVPATMAQALKEHVEQCPKHPMSSLRVERDRLRGLYADMVNQFVLYFTNSQGVEMVGSGGLSDLEAAFYYFKMFDPCPLTEFRAALAAQDGKEMPNGEN